MRRRTVRPYGQSVKGLRVISMLMAMVVLWMLYERLKDPATWRVVFQDRLVAESSVGETPKPSEFEKLVPGPNDRDPDEVAAIKDQFEAIIDRAPLKPREMDAYWRLMDWSLTQPFSEMERRSKDDVPYTQLWEQPELYRGKLIHLQLHARRVLQYPAQSNPSEIPDVYETWGWTDESRSYPYVLVSPEASPDLPVGAEVRAEVEFVGYFLKTLSFKAGDKQRGAPLLVGRIKLISKPVAAKPSPLDPWVIPLILIGASAFLGYSVWSSRRSRRRSSLKILPKDLSVAEPPTDDDLQNPFAHLAEETSPSSSICDRSYSMRRRITNSRGNSVNGIRIIAVVIATLGAWMSYEYLKAPDAWRGISQDRLIAQVSAAESPAIQTTKPPEAEKLVPGPNDLDPDEFDAIKDQFEAIIDKAPLKSREMDAYWRLMDWSLTQPFAEMEKRARDDVPFTQLWEQPDLYRGKLIRLQMHVRRVLEYPAPANPSEISKVYEAWGWTDESRSFPYVVVFPDATPDLPVGTDVRAEIVFVGYFLKVMTYTAFDTPRGAPLLIGRAKVVSRPAATKAAKVDPWVITLILIGGAAFLGFSIWTSLRVRRKSSIKMLPKELAVDRSPTDDDAVNPFIHLGEHVPSPPTPPPEAPISAGTVEVADQASVPTPDSANPSVP